MSNQIVTTMATFPQEVRPPIGRQTLYRMLATFIWCQYCLENAIVDTPFEQAPKDVQTEILQTCEALANMVLNPDLRDTAICCLADAICRGNYRGDITLSEAAPRAQQQYLTTAQDALRTFLLNMQEVPPDYHYRVSMCRLLDGIAPKKGVH